ncbi:ribonuclease Z [Clostridium botulinum]|uniref:ribonuclease Z n=1 Tax=Clostridium botulinum TaxID=1491 RepID=UPI0013F12D21|nr:ribonuclease Z [Clostridium botulinum]NFG23867.1 ribonuclease Z [Clostridium botulinum]NFR15421.1 ribonuclease Z [Clostridium botulinum]NFR45087.1 ribonuclease Z [Clostridium botulinum]NFS49396.1 ribonuclease Z [Clostridium botulinum]UZP04337.1 ribonuclease Z [Clostridium botulinum]
MIDLCILGTTGGMPMVNKYLSATLININGRKILIDCGEGTQVAMREIGWGFKSIDLICITHSHGDHTIGLPGLLSTMGNSGRTEKVIIVGPKGIKEIVNGLNIINPYLPYELEVVELENNDLKFIIDKNNIFLCEDNDKCNLILSSLEVEHSAKCLSYSFYIKRRPRFSIEKASKNNVPKLLWSKLQNQEIVNYDNKIYTPDLVLDNARKGIKISYVTDTRPISTLPQFIKYSDLFICEGTYGSDEDIDKAIKNKHMTFRESATLAKKGECNELILTHFSPALSAPENFLNNAKEIFHNSIVAHDGLIKTLKFID